MPTFHHKTSLEDFTLDTGISWKTVKKKSNDVKVTTPKFQFKKIKNEILEKIDYMIVSENKSFKQIRDELVLLESEGKIPSLGYANKDSKYFNNMYLKWKKSQKSS